MTVQEKITLLTSPPPKQCCLADYYQGVLEKVGTVVYNYYDYLTGCPIDCDKELKRLATADYQLCCALLTMLFREDYWSYGGFDDRYRNGDVSKILDRMVVLLKKEESTRKRLSQRAAEYRMFRDD